MRRVIETPERRVVTISSESVVWVYVRRLAFTHVGRRWVTTHQRFWKRDAPPK